MFFRQSHKSRLLFAILDILLTTLAFLIAYELRQNLTGQLLFFLTPAWMAFLLTGSAATWVAVGRYSGAYDRLTGGGIWSTFWDTVRQAVLAGIILILFEYTARLNLSRLFLGFYLVLSSVFLLVARLGFLALRPRLYRLGPGSHVLVGGTGPAALRIAAQVQASSGFGLKLIGFLDDEAGQITLDRSYPVHPFRELARFLEMHIVDEIIFAVDTQKLAELEELLLLCDSEGVRTRVTIDFFPHVNSTVYLDRLGDSPLLTFAGAPHDDPRLIIKRATDFLLGLAALILASPLMLAVAIAIRLSSPGPVIFGQLRCGLNGRRFTCYKFRTMDLDAEARKPDLAHLNVRKTAFKIPNDPRVTPLGRWLRRFSIDEWPQLWNVVRGEMSLVGPRPPVPSEVENYERWQRRRLRMRPGLTCLWALAGRDQLEFDDWMRLDLTYIDNWSLTLDWSIILRTIPHVMAGRNAS